jgi:hypothetical protein
MPVARLKELSMPPRASFDDHDPHSTRVVVDTVEWHDRLERLPNMRRDWASFRLLATGPSSLATMQNKQRPSRQPQRLKNCSARSCFSAACPDAKVPRLRRCPVFGFTFSAPKANSAGQLADRFGPQLAESTLKVSQMLVLNHSTFIVGLM